jgi:hypothetical protein
VAIGKGHDPGTAGWYSTGQVGTVLGIGASRFRTLVSRNKWVFDHVDRDGAGNWHPDVVEVARVLLGKDADSIGSVRQHFLEEHSGEI